MLRQVLVVSLILHHLTQRLADQDLARGRLGAEPGGDVHRVADHGVLQPAVAADVAGEDLAVVDPDADADLGPALRQPSARSAGRSPRCMATAARSARSGSSAWAIGAPQSAMIASPMNLSSVPPCSKITSTISVKYSVSSWAMASGPMRLRHRGEAADVAEEHGDRPALAAQADDAVLLRDLGGDVGREVALEVGADQRLAPDLLGVAAVLDADGGEAAERDEELEVLVAEGVGRGEVVHVEQAQHPVAGRHEGRAHRAPHALSDDRLPLEPAVGRRVVRHDGHPLLHDLVDDGPGHLLELRRRPGGSGRSVGTSSPVASLRSRMVTRSTSMTSNVMSTTLRSSRSRSSSPESFWETSSSSESFLRLALLGGGGRHPELPAAGAAVAAGDAGRATAAHHELADDVCRRPGSTRLRGDRGWAACPEGLGS